MKKPLAFVILSCLCFISSLSLAQPAGYSYVKEIIIHESQIPDGAALSNFPLLYKVTDPDMRTVANGGHVQDNSGHDIIFYLNACDTKLDHQLESYNPVTGELTAWVRIPSLSSTSNTRIYTYYGNNTVAASTSTNAVWDNTYSAVWHLNDNPAGTAPQVAYVTSHGRHGTTYGSMSAARLVAGKIEGAYNFDEVNDHVRIPDFLYGQELTVSFWFNLSEVNGGSYQYMFSHGPWSTPNSLNVYIGEDNITIPSEIQNLQMLKTVFRDSNDANNFDTLDVGNTWVDGNWHYYTMRIQNTGGASTYIDGILRRQYTVWGANTFDPVTDIYLGGREDLNSARFFGGSLDEVRISTAWRSANWIRAEFNNQNSPASFFTAGLEGPYLSFCLPLPLSMIGFSAARSGPHVQLDWETDNQADPATFFIERAADGANWQCIGTLLSAYTFIDSFPLAQSSFYRVRYTQGNTMYLSVIKKVEMPKNAEGYTLYPNPSFNGQFWLDFESHESPQQVVLLNTMGVELQRMSIKKGGDRIVRFNAGGQAKGLYFLRVDFADRSEIKKILIQ